MIAGYTWQDIPVTLTPQSDVTHHLRPGNRLAWVVQEILDGIDRLDVDEDFIQTFNIKNPNTRKIIFPMADQVRSGTKRVWGIHAAHKARKPGLSPFINQQVDSDEMGRVTLELSPRKSRILLTRAYGGRYTPPLPWMLSAKDIEGGVEVCEEYWQTHAYVSRNMTLIRPGTSTNLPPEWWLTGQNQQNIQTAS